MLRCSEEAYAQCPDRKWCGSIENAIFTAGSECDEFNREVEDMPMTNGDRLRVMSDKELADFLVDQGYCPRDIDWDCMLDNQGCAACVLKWLQAFVEE